MIPKILLATFITIKATCYFRHSFEISEWFDRIESGWYQRLSQLSDFWFW